MSNSSDKGKGGGKTRSTRKDWLQGAPQTHQGGKLWSCHADLQEDPEVWLPFLPKGIDGGPRLSQTYKVPAHWTPNRSYSCPSCKGHLTSREYSVRKFSSTSLKLVRPMRIPCKGLRVPS